MESIQLERISLLTRAGRAIFHPNRTRLNQTEPARTSSNWTQANQPESSQRFYWANLLCSPNRRQRFSSPRLGSISGLVAGHSPSLALSATANGLNASHCKPMPIVRDTLTHIRAPINSHIIPNWLGNSISGARFGAKICTKLSHQPARCIMLFVRMSICSFARWFVYLFILKPIEWSRPPEVGATGSERNATPLKVGGFVEARVACSRHTDNQSSSNLNVVDHQFSAHCLLIAQSVWPFWFGFGFGFGFGFDFDFGRIQSGSGSGSRALEAKVGLEMAK